MHVDAHTQTLLLFLTPTKPPISLNSLFLFSWCASIFMTLCFCNVQGGQMRGSTPCWSFIDGPDSLTMKTLIRCIPPQRERTVLFWGKCPVCVTRPTSSSKTGTTVLRGVQWLTQSSLQLHLFYSNVPCSSGREPVNLVFQSNSDYAHKDFVMSKPITWDALQDPKVIRQGVQQNGSVGKGACLQTWQPEFSPQGPHGRWVY